MLLTTLSICTLSLAAPQEGRGESAPAFRDPAPPTVAELAPGTAPEPAAYPELTVHRAPSPLAAGAVVEDWPAFLGPRRDGHSAERPLALAFPAEGPPLVWEMERGEGYASPVVAGDKLVFTHRLGDEAVVDCLEATTGKRFWRYRYSCAYKGRYIDNGGPRATPAIAGERVYVHGVEGVLTCLDLATGRVVWQRDTTKEFEVGDDFFGVVSSPLISGDLLIQNVGAPGGPSVAAFDRHTGRLVWGAGREWGPSCASPIVARVADEEKLFVLAGGMSRPPTGGLMVIDPADASLELAYPFRSRTFESVNGATPVVAGARVFLTSSYGAGSACLELRSGKFEELWKNRHLGLQFSTPLFEGGALYAVDGVSGRAGAVSVIDPATGEELSRTSLSWEETVVDEGKERTLTSSVGEGSLLYADGHFLVLGDSGHLLTVRASAEKAEVLARSALFHAPESWTPLALSHGLLYVCQNNRARFGDSPPRLLCYDLRGGGGR